MTRFLASRVASGLVTLFFFVTVLFFLVNIAVDGDWTSQYILTAEQRAALQDTLGIGGSLWEQYRAWLTAAATLDFGVSLSGADVWTEIRAALASTALVLTVGLGISFGVGSWLGRRTAWNRRAWLTGTGTFVAVICLTAFPPALAFFFERGAQNVLGFGDLAALQSLDGERWRSAGIEPSTWLWRMVTVLLAAAVIAALVVRLMERRSRWRGLVAAAVVVVGPIIVWTAWRGGALVLDLAGRAALITAGIVVLTFGEVTLITRAAMDDVRSDGFVTTARAVGLTPVQVRSRAARVTMLPVLTRLVVAIPAFLTGLVILESVFGIGGMGSLIFEALRLQDTPLVAGGLLVVGFVTIVLRIGLDIAHVVLDPRLRSAKGPAGE